MKFGLHQSSGGKCKVGTLIELPNTLLKIEGCTLDCRFSPEEVLSRSKKSTNIQTLQPSWKWVGVLVKKTKMIKKNLFVFCIVSRCIISDWS